MCQQATPASHKPPATPHASTAKVEDERSMPLDPYHSLHAHHSAWIANESWAKFGPHGLAGQQWEGLPGLRGLQGVGLQPETPAEQGEAVRMGGPGRSLAAAWAEGLADCHADLATHNQLQQQQQLPRSGVAPQHEALHGAPRGALHGAPQHGALHVAPHGALEGVQQHGAPQHGALRMAPYGALEVPQHGAPQHAALLTEEMVASIAASQAGLNKSSSWEGRGLGEGCGSCGAYNLEAGTNGRPLAPGLPQDYNPAVIPDITLARIAHAASFCAQSVAAQGGNSGGAQAAKADSKAGGSQAAGAENEAAHSSGVVPGIEKLGSNSWGNIVRQQQSEQLLQQQQQQQQQQQEQYPWADLQEPEAATIGTSHSLFQLWPVPPPPPPPQPQPLSAVGMASSTGAPTASMHLSRAAAELFLPACQLLWAGLPGMSDVRSLLQVALAATAVPGRGSGSSSELASAACARVGAVMQYQLVETSAALPAALRLATQRARWHALSRRRLMSRADANMGIGFFALRNLNRGAASGEACSTHALHLLEGANGAPSQWELLAHTSLALQSFGRGLPRQAQRRLGRWQGLILQLQQLEHQLHMQLQQQQQQQWHRQQDPGISFIEPPDPHSQQQVQSAWAQQAQQERHPPSNYWASTLSSESLGSDWSSCVGAVSAGGAAACQPTAAAGAAPTAVLNPAESNYAGRPLWCTSQRAHQQQLLQLVQALQNLRDAVLLRGVQSDEADSAAHSVSPAVQEVQSSILQALQVQLEQTAVDLGPSVLLLPSCNPPANPVHEPWTGRGAEEASGTQHHRGDLRHAAPEALPGRGSAGASEGMQLQRGDLGRTTTEAPPGKAPAEEDHKRKGQQGSSKRESVSMGRLATKAPLGGVSAGELLRVWEVLGDVYCPPAWVARPELADAWLQAAWAAMVAGRACVSQICRIVRIAIGVPPCTRSPHVSALCELPQGPFDNYLSKPHFPPDHHQPQTSVSPQALGGQHQQQHQHQHQHQRSPQTPISPQATRDHLQQRPLQTPFSPQASRYQQQQQQQQQQQHSALNPPLFSCLPVPLSQQLQLLEAAGAALHHQPHPPSASCFQLATFASAAWAVRKAHALHRTHPTSSISIDSKPPIHHTDTSRSALHTKAPDSYPSYTSTTPSRVCTKERSSTTPTLHRPLPALGPSLPSPATDTTLQAELDCTLRQASLHLVRPLWPPIPLQLRALIGWMEEAAGARLGSVRQRHASQSLFAGRSPPRANTTTATPALFHHPQGLKMVRQLGLPAVAALLNLTSVGGSSSSSGGGIRGGRGFMGTHAGPSTSGGGKGLVGTHAGPFTCAFWAVALSAAAANQVVRMYEAWVARSSSLHVHELGSRLAPAPVGLDTILDLAAVLEGKRVHLAFQDWACAHLRAAHHAAAVHKVLDLPWHQLKQPLKQQPQDSWQLKQHRSQGPPSSSHDTQKSDSFQDHAGILEGAELLEDTNASFLSQVQYFHAWRKPPQSASAAAAAAAAAETPRQSFSQLSSPAPGGALSLTPSPAHFHGQFSSSPSTLDPLSPRTTTPAPDRPDVCAQLRAAYALNGAALQVEALLAGAVGS
ncbi:hypothetical protein DUNSADRAFT_1359 [Dunaliella salina]|uniref:Uncharacterized protein n=1 Tax=Dunaliella salina TaxID=3046 RepID=A0ABQ7GX93_DUNSA|nr:hypothetical protein DUNSADRAFT_1359 [Dunaliella salina]|eukprot:KAF5839223.1 hypothetical protein DUNSADRAFT_1359 [Dunaliella salina]